MRRLQLRRVWRTCVGRITQDRANRGNTGELISFSATARWRWLRFLGKQSRVGWPWRTNELGAHSPMSAFGVPAQPVDATQALNFSAGVSNPRVLRGRSLSWRATLLRWACEYTDKSAPFGKYCLSRPLVFSLEPRCHGLCGSQK